MMSDSLYRTAFLVLLVGILAMRGYFMWKVRRAGERLMPGQGAVEREGGHAVFVLRVVVFLVFIAFLVMYIAGMAWIDVFSFPFPAWLRWAGFASACSAWRSGPGHRWHWTHAGPPNCNYAKNTNW